MSYDPKNMVSSDKFSNTGTICLGEMSHVWEDRISFIAEQEFEMDFEEQVVCVLSIVEIIYYNYVSEICQALQNTFKMPLYILSI